MTRLPVPASLNTKPLRPARTLNPTYLPVKIVPLKPRVKTEMAIELSKKLPLTLMNFGFYDFP